MITYKQLIKEFNLDVKVGDTVLLGRFKNKKVVVKSIEISPKGDLMINGRNAAKFRIVQNEPPVSNMTEKF